jgi:hypothetical protein
MTSTPYEVNPIPKRQKGSKFNATLQNQSKGLPSSTQKFNLDKNPFQVPNLMQPY